MVTATVKNQAGLYTPVKVLEAYQDGQGRRWAAVEALSGKPFTGGDKWPVRTQYATVQAAQLADVLITSQQ